MYKFTDEDRKWMTMAATLADKNVDCGGGPFGAVIVRDGVLVAAGVNTVTLACDPTAHAEVNAIRNACRRTDTFRLAGCTVYSSCEPCPMCLSALYWAGVDKIIYGNTQDDAAAIGFSDSFIYKELARPAEYRSLPQLRMKDSGAIRAFEKWAGKADKVEY